MKRVGAFLTLSIIATSAMPVAAQSDVYRCAASQYFHFYMDLGSGVRSPKDGGPLKHVAFNPIHILRP